MVIHPATGQLLIEYQELVFEGGLSIFTYKKHKRLGSFEVLGRGGNGNKVYIIYESLPERYKNIILGKWGDPYFKAEADELISFHLHADSKAVKFYLDHKLPDGTHLSPEDRQRMIVASKWMNLIADLKHNTGKIDREMRKRLLKDRWSLLIRIMASADPKPDIPMSYYELGRKLKNYSPVAGKRQYATLVHKGFGNANTVKVRENDQESLLITMISDHRKFPDTQVAQMYNTAADSQGWPTITPATVRNYRLMNSHLVAAARSGGDSWLHHKRAQVKRSKPSMAGMLTEYDGWTVELAFQNRFVNDSGKKVRDYYARLELMTIYDPFNDFILGYYIGKEKPETIRKAVKNAVDTIFKLTGRYILLNELVTDNYQIKNLKPFYDAATVINRQASVGNSKDKTIESFFARLNAEYFRVEHNTTGQNITSKKENQPNMDWLDSHKQMLPTLEDGYEQIRSIIERHRSERIQVWLDSFLELIESGRITEISRERYLEVFGETTGHTNRLTASGMHIKIEGKTICYDLLNPVFRSQMHLDWVASYDTNDLSTILVTNPETRQQFYLSQKAEVPLAAMERTEAHKDVMKKVWAFNAKDKSEITERLAQVRETTEDFIDNSKILSLKTRLILDGKQKESLQDAKRVIDLDTIPHPSRIRDTRTPEQRAIDDL